MKQILKVLGTSFIMAIVVLGLLIILTSISFTSKGKTYSGIFEVLGMTSTIEGPSYSSSDSAAFESVAASKRPDIYFEKTGLEALIKNKDIEILKYFRVIYNCEESGINAEEIEDDYLKVLDITDENGESFMHLYNKKFKTINFDHSDIYTITFYLIDIEQKETTAKIRIPIN